MAEMDAVQFKAILGAYVREAEDFVQSEILDWREDADTLYRGEPLGNEIEGRSQVVDRSITDAIEWMVPQFMRMFHGSDQPVSFEPAEPSDEAVADQATQFVTLVYTRDNPGSQITEEVLRSALLYRYGAALRWWDTKKTVTEEDFRLTLDDLTARLDEPGTELVQSYADDEESDAETGGEMLPDAMGGAPQAAPAMPPMAPPIGGTALPPQMPPAAMGAPGAILPPGAPMAPPQEPKRRYRLRFTKTTKRECVRSIPMGEFLVDKRAQRLSEAGLLGYKRSLTRSELVAMGYDRALVNTLPFDDDEDKQRGDDFASQAQRAEQANEQAALDEANRLVSVYYLWVRIDKDGDGIAELRRVVCAGKNIAEILEDEITDAAPIEGFTPIMVPNRLVGLSVAELAKDIQVIKTTLWRQMLDGLYLSTTPVTDVATGALDASIGLDDFLVRRPGGIRRVRDISGIRESLQQWGGAQAFPMLEYLDQQASRRTGVSEQSVGLSPDLLNPNVTATAALQALSTVQTKLELIARRFAETFLKPLFIGILRDLTRYQDEARMVRLTGRFVPIDPKGWNVDMDVKVNVGLGTAAQDKRIAMLSQILAVQKEALMAGGLGGMVTPKQIHNTMEDLIRAGELVGVERYFAEPQPPDPNAPPPPDPAMAKVQGELEIRKAETEAKLKGDAMKGQMEVQQQDRKAQQDAVLAERKAAQEMALAERKMMLDAERADRELAGRMRLREMEMAGEFRLKEMQIRMAGQQQGETEIARPQ